MFAPVFAALAILLALAESPSPEPPPTPTVEVEQQHRDGDAEKQEIKPVTPPIIAPTQSSEEAKHHRDNRDDESSNDWRSDWRFIFAAVLAIAGIAKVIALIHQGVIARRQCRATQESAAAAIQNVQTNRISNRAKVVVEKLVFYDVDDATRETIRFAYKVKNTGKSTAHIFERLDTVQIIDNPLPDGPPVLGGAPKAEPFDLAPDRDDVNFIGGAFEKSGLDMTKFTGEKAELYAFGVIRYRDDFGSEWSCPYSWQYRRTGPAFFVQQAGYDNPA